MRMYLATDPGTMETAISNLWNCEPKYVCPTFKWLLSNNLKITSHQAVTSSIWQIIYGSKHIVLGLSLPFSSIICFLFPCAVLPLSSSANCICSLWNVQQYFDVISKNKTVRVGEMVHWLRIHDVLSNSRATAPSTYKAFNSSSRRLIVSSGLHGHPNTCEHTYVQSHIHIAHK